MHPLNTLNSYVFINVQTHLRGRVRSSSANFLSTSSASFLLRVVKLHPKRPSVAFTQCEWPLRRTQSHFRAAVEYARRKNKRIRSSVALPRVVVWWSQTETGSLRSLIMRRCFVSRSVMSITKFPPLLGSFDVQVWWAFPCVMLLGWRGDKKR